MEHSRKGQIYTDIVLETFKLSGLLGTQGDELAGEFGLTSARWKILGALVYSDFKLTVSQIAVAMGQTRQSVQRLANAMVEDGLLEYIDNPAHKKAKLVNLTKNGRKVYAGLEKKQIPWANSISASFSQQDLKTTLEVLKQLSEVLKNPA